MSSRIIKTGKWRAARRMLLIVAILPFLGACSSKSKGGASPKTGSSAPGGASSSTDNAPLAPENTQATIAHAGSPAAITAEMIDGLRKKIASLPLPRKSSKSNKRVCYEQLANALDGIRLGIRNLNGGIRVDTTSFGSVLCLAASLDEGEVVDALLGLGADPKKSSTQDENAFHVVCNVGNLPILEKLFKHTPPMEALNDKDTQGDTYFMKAVKSADQFFVEAMVEFLQREYFKEPAQWAAFVENAATPNRKGKTPLKIAQGHSKDGTKRMEAYLQKIGMST